MSDNVAEARAWLDEAREPVLLVLDGAMSFGQNGNQGIGELRRRYPDLRLVIADWRRDRRMALQAIAEGAHGYIPKDLDQDELLHAFNLVMSGQVYVPSVVSEVEVENPALGSGPPRQAALPGLTQRQREVLTHMAAGKSNKEIARSLRISESTVKVHVAAAFRLLGVHNRVGAVALLQSRSAGTDTLANEPGGFGRRASDRAWPNRVFG